MSDAARGGDGRALARVAALTAAGAYLPQDWPASIRLLGEAAAAGDAAARGQLLACSRARVRGGRQVAGVQADGQLACGWTWLGPASLVALHEKVQRVPAWSPLPVCAWLIGRAHGPAGARHGLRCGERGSDEVHEMRTNTMAMYDYATLDVVQFLVQARMSLTCGYRMQHFETPTILHYKVGEQITPHFDFIDAKAPTTRSRSRERASA